ncbi:MAG TPA: DNA/RNA nuclease SfsA [Oceanospirillales bacterium]|nr:DNA/RNA nuclease SfsA [Oleispira sp.]HCM06533.1 DNA/RNA nuclease SfsA [Oceanospirillales bacterium]|tara:strand:+ start:490 stop:1239 length:750 start_codon:yes stop_codon:yes gene_type:complete
MKYERPLLTGKLIQRYKRFLSDIELITPVERAGEIVTAHCANTGSMTNCKDEGAKVWLFDSQNPKRKLPLSWEWVEVEGKYKACINTARANQLVKEALLANKIKEVHVNSAECLKSEPKVDEGRLDFLVNPKEIYIEVKSVTLLGAEGVEEKDNVGYFPDAVTSRGLKHIEVLMRLKAEGKRAILFFCVPHEGIHEVKVAEHIDPAYAAKLREAMAMGVEVLAYQVEFQPNPQGQVQGMELKNPLIVNI